MTNNVENTDHVMTVLPKLEWKRLRNKYLNLQRKNITHSKMKLHQFYEKQKEELKCNIAEEKTEESKGNFLKNSSSLYLKNPPKKRNIFIFFFHFSGLFFSVFFYFCFTKNPKNLDFSCVEANHS